MQRRHLPKVCTIHAPKRGHGCAVHTPAQRQPYRIHWQHRQQQHRQQQAAAVGAGSRRGREGERQGGLGCSYLRSQRRCAPPGQSAPGRRQLSPPRQPGRQISTCCPAPPPRPARQSQLFPAAAAWQARAAAGARLRWLWPARPPAPPPALPAAAAPAQTGAVAAAALSSPHQVKGAPRCPPVPLPALLPRGDLRSLQHPGSSQASTGCQNRGSCRCLCHCCRGAAGLQVPPEAAPAAAGGGARGRPAPTAGWQTGSGPGVELACWRRRWCRRRRYWLLWLPRLPAAAPAAPLPAAPAGASAQCAAASWPVPRPHQPPAFDSATSRAAALVGRQAGRWACWLR